MKLRMIAFTLIAALMFTFVGQATPTYADTSLVSDQGDQFNTQKGGAAGLVAAVVQAQDLVDAGNVQLVSIDSSFNNLRALNNVLRNSRILNNNDINVEVITLDVFVEDVLNNNDILNEAFQDFLNNNDVGTIVGIGVLGQGGGFIIFE